MTDAEVHAHMETVRVMCAGFRSVWVNFGPARLGCYLCFFAPLDYRKKQFMMGPEAIG